MLNLQKKLKEQKDAKSQPSPGNRRDSALVRDRLLMTEVQELPQSLPAACRVEFPSSELHNFFVTIRPDEGMYAGGRFRFHITVPLEYNFEPPAVKCLTKVWHPNISETGSVCLSVLRSLSIDGTGWSPARGIKDVIFGIYALFGDLMDFDDPLNLDAANMYQRNPVEFKSLVYDYIRRYCKNN